MWNSLLVTLVVILFFLVNLNRYSKNKNTVKTLAKCNNYYDSNAIYKGDNFNSTSIWDSQINDHTNIWDNDILTNPLYSNISGNIYNTDD